MRVVDQFLRSRTATKHRADALFAFAHFGRPLRGAISKPESPTFLGCLGHFSLLKPDTALTWRISNLMYAEQGKEFSLENGSKAFWIDHEYIFLYIPPPDGDITTSTLKSGKICLGFNVHKLSLLFLIKPRDLLLNNQLGALTFRTEYVAAEPPAHTTAHFIFGLPSHATVLVSVSAVTIAGSA